TELFRLLLGFIERRFSRYKHKSSSQISLSFFQLPSSLHKPSSNSQHLSDTSPSRPARQVTFLKPAADTTLDRKASIVDETSGITRTQMKDGDGTITKEELGRVMRSLGQFARVEELQDMLQESMSGAGGGTSSAEQEERELRDAFRVFDKHNRGYICASDLRAVLQCLGEDLSEEEKFVRALGEPEDAVDDDEEEDATSPDMLLPRPVPAIF
ncbi:Uncharacterized protein OBRU01_11021, partial [Operophtera brumata]